jgi:hypothetical protein
MPGTNQNGSHIFNPAQLHAINVGITSSVPLSAEAPANLTVVIDELGFMTGPAVGAGGTGGSTGTGGSAGTGGAGDTGGTAGAGGTGGTGGAAID